MIQRFAKAHTVLDEFCFRCVEQQFRELAVVAQHGGHVRLIRQLRVHLGPVMRRTNEGEIRDQEFKRGVANRRANGRARACGASRRQKHDRQRVEEIGLGLRARLRQPTGKGDTLEAIKDRRERRPVGQWTLEELDPSSIVSVPASESPAGRP